MTASRFTRAAALVAVSGVALALPSLAQAATTAQVANLASARPVTLGGDATAVPPLGDNLADLSFDARATLKGLAPTAGQRAAVARITGALATWNTTGTPRSIARTGGFLSPASSGAPVSIARRWLDRNRAAFGLSSRDISSLAVLRDHELPGIKARVVSFAQTFGGVQSGIGGILTVVVDRDGRVVSYAGDPVRDTRLRGSFVISAAEALTGVVASLAPGLDFVAEATGASQGGYQVFKGGLLGPDQLVRKIAFPTAQGARAAYAVLSIIRLDEAWVTIVDAATGRPMLRKSLVQSETDGEVYENYPGAKRGGTQVRKSFGPTKQSPGGWLDPTGQVGLPGITTLGNNANTAIAWTVPLVAVDQYNRPVSPLGQFRYDFTNGWEKSKASPLGYQADANAAATNLFYHHNRIHDEFYKFGFTESGGNFQVVNKPGSGGLGGDPIMGGAQSGALNLTASVLALGRNNANMLTLPDGIPGFTNMYLWEFVDDVFEGPNRDGDFDASIIEHEYAHGLSNRYVGGGGLGSLGTTQSGAMGEGWGDWFAMNDLFRRGLTRSAVTAPYVGDPQRGIRNWNYAKSPATFGDYGYDMSGPEVHSDGEIWTATLWTLRSKILATVGGNHKQASDIAEHLVMDAMPISPPSPSMLDMRDAILKAGELRYKQKYTGLIWDAFAERGYGFSATTKGETDTDPVPGFDVANTSANGTLVLRFRNASAGGAVNGVRVLGGRFEGRATAIVESGKDGVAKARFAGGSYTLTLQAPGYGIQRLAVTVPAGRTTTRTILLRPNLLSRSAGATIKATSQAGAFPAENLVDDTEATAWRTGTFDKAYNDGPSRSAVIELAKPSVIDTVAVSVIKPIGVARFAAANKVLVQVSNDAKSWRTVKVARFSFKGPRPSVADLGLKTYRLGKPVKARYVRAVAASVFGSTAETASTAVVAEVQAFGRAAGIRPKLPKADKPVVLEGSVALGNPAQGSLLGLDPYRKGATELAWTCGSGLPAANGGDAYFHELPAGAGDGLHAATVGSEVVLGEYLLYFYDENCAPLAGGGFVLDGETAVIPPGAAYSGMLLLYGGGLDYQLKITEPR